MTNLKASLKMMCLHVLAQYQQAKETSRRNNRPDFYLSGVLQYVAMLLHSAAAPFQPASH